MSPVGAWGEDIQCNLGWVLVPVTAHLALSLYVQLLPFTWHCSSASLENISLVRQGSPDNELQRPGISYELKQISSSQSHFRFLKPLRVPPFWLLQILRFVGLINTQFEFSNHLSKPRWRVFVPGLLFFFFFSPVRHYHSKVFNSEWVRPWAVSELDCAPDLSEIICVIYYLPRQLKH